MMNQATGKNGKIASFGRAKAKVNTDDKKKVLFKDVAGADGSRSAEGFPYVDFIVLLKEGTVNDTEDVLLMILPVCACLTLCDLRQLKMQTVIGWHIVFLFQHGSDGGGMAIHQ